jgi:AraC-like DNA-binding protein/mannose-6-phosphate isomerase-like protein (cupin superfamily)
MDTLSALLSLIRLQGAVFLSGRFSAPWSVVAPDGAEACHRLMPGAEHLILFHLVVEGQCDVVVGDAPPQRVPANHAVILPRGTAHRLASHAALAGHAIQDLMEVQPGTAIRTLRHGGGGASCRIQCGFLSCDPRMAGPLLESLPELLVVSLDDGGGLPWLMSMLDHAVNEAAAAQSGYSAVLARLSELMFVEAVRRHLHALPPGQSGWLAGLRDRVLARALTALHAEPARDWTLAALATEAGASRSVINQRFADYLGRSPMDYLTQWRLQLAAQRLRESADSVAQIAEAVGYASPAAFNRAFKRMFGVPPARWRRG